MSTCPSSTARDVNTVFQLTMLLLNEVIIFLAAQNISRHFRIHECGSISCALLWFIQAINKLASLHLLYNCFFYKKLIFFVCSVSTDLLFTLAVHSSPYVGIMSPSHVSCQNLPHHGQTGIRAIVAGLALRWILLYQNCSSSDDLLLNMSLANTAWQAFLQPCVHPCQLLEPVPLN